MSQTQSPAGERAGPLSQQQLDAFWHDGYVAIGRVLDDEQLAAMRTAYDELLEQARHARDLRAGADAEAQKRSVTQIMNAFQHHIAFTRLLFHERILDAVESVTGPQIALFHDQALYKAPHTGGAVPWHQDNGYWGLVPATAVSCWLTLDDADRDNGAMQVIPGSHLHPRRQTGAAGATLQETDDVDASQARVVDVPAGGAMLHHCQTLHHTQDNTTDRPRRAFAIHCMVPGTRKGDGEPLPLGWEHPLLRARI